MVEKNEKNVQVLLRIRPMIGTELIEMERSCVICFDEQNIVQIGQDRQFQFDKLFSPNSQQVEVYNQVSSLCLTCFEGYNATVLAYGQTGSGKTYTMGTGDVGQSEEDEGLVPRVIDLLFQKINEKKQDTEFTVKASFCEIHNEEIHDLLDSNGKNMIQPRKQIQIRESKTGQISLLGLLEQTVETEEELMRCLQRGSLYRSTASTLMNAHSSRSHAIFTISIEQNKIMEEGESQYFTSKLHFVDLAGSERLKRTGAKGDTMKEGISINKGLLCLGNVISALTDEKKPHVPYRDSKLTRILQDSLGGNAMTTMVACISPAEINFEESLNTLKYATRARHIKNKPVINTDPAQVLISQLRQQIYDLTNELKIYKRVVSGGGDNLAEEISKIKQQGDDSQSQDLRQKVSTLENQIIQLQRQSLQLQGEYNEMKIKIFECEKQRDEYRYKFEKSLEVLEANNLKLGLSEQEQDFNQQPLFVELQQRAEKFQKAFEEETILKKDLQKEYEKMLKESEDDQQFIAKKNQEIEQLHKELARLRLKLKQGKEHQNQQLQQSSLAQSIQGSVNQNIQFQISSLQEQLEAKINQQHYESQQQQQKFESNIRSTEQELSLVEGTLQEKEELIVSIQESLRTMQRNLIEDMNFSYISKISELEKEILTLEKQKKGSGNQEQQIGLQSKIKELESQIKDFRKKIKNQEDLLKLNEKQKSKLVALDQEVLKIRNQKAELIKRLKEQNKDFAEFKINQQKQFLQMKKEAFQKDKQIQKLQAESKRKDIQISYKSEAIKKLSSQTQILRQIQQERSQKRQSQALGININTPRNQSIQQINPSNNISIQSNATTLQNLAKDPKEWLNFQIQELTMLRESKSNLKAAQGKKKTIESQIEILRKQQASFKLQKEKFEVQKQDADFETVKQLDSQIQKIEEELNGIQEKIESYEEQSFFYEQKIQEYEENCSQDVLEEFQFKIQEICQQNDMIVQIMHISLRYIVQEKQKSRQLQISLQKKELLIKELESKLEKTIQIARMEEAQHQLQLSQVEKEYEELNLILLNQLDDKNACNDLDIIKQMHKQQKEIQKMQQRYQVLLEQFEKISVSSPSIQAKKETSQNYANIKITNLQKAREKNKLQSRFKRSTTTESMSKLEKDDVFERLNTQQTLSFGKKQREKSSAQELFQPISNETYTVMQNIKAHNGPVLSITSYENVLYSSGLKTIKVWNIDSQKEITSIETNGNFIGKIIVIPELKLLAAACDKIVNFWDINSFQHVGMLKGHKDRIRTLSYIKDFNYFITAGKGSQTNYSLLF